MSRKGNGRRLRDNGLLGLGEPEGRPSLITPQEALFERMRATLGRDRHIHVRPPVGSEGFFVCDIVVEDPIVGEALAALLGQEHTLSSETLRIRVVNAADGRGILGRLATSGGPDDDVVSDLALTVENAFRGNPLFVRAIERRKTTHMPIGVGEVIAVFDPEVVRWWTDDISDLHYMRSMVAAEAFRPFLLSIVNGMTFTLATDATR